MYGEEEPEIHEPEYSDESLRKTLTTEGEETPEQVAASWWEDQAGFVAPTSDVPVTDVSPTDVVDPATTQYDDVPPEQMPTDVQAVPLPPQEQSVQQVPSIEQTPAPTFNLDMSQWCDPTLPTDWETWAPSTQPGEESWTDEGYSTDWGQVDATWAQEGEELWTVTQPETPLSDVVGPGHLADQYWGYQGQTNYCVLYSAASILGEIFGQPIDMDEMVARADANDWLVYENGVVKGVADEHFDDLLASYGVPTHQLEGEQGAWDALNSAMTSDQRVIISLDSKEIDAGQDQGTDVDADHAVAVTGIDYANSVVIVNDSAREAGLEIPMDVFYEAWRDGGFHMTITDVAMPGGEGAVPPPGAGAPRADAPGFAVLPFTLHGPSDVPTLGGGRHF